MTSEPAIRSPPAKLQGRAGMARRPQISHEIHASPEALVAPGVPTPILYVLLLFGKRKCDILFAFACVPTHSLS